MNTFITFNINHSSLHHLTCISELLPNINFIFTFLLEKSKHNSNVDIKTLTSWSWTSELLLKQSLPTFCTHWTNEAAHLPTAHTETLGVSISQECGPQVGEVGVQDSHLWRMWTWLATLQEIDQIYEGRKLLYFVYFHFISSWKLLILSILIWRETEWLLHLFIFFILKHFLLFSFQSNDHTLGLIVSQLLNYVKTDSKRHFDDKFVTKQRNLFECLFPLFEQKLIFCTSAGCYNELRLFLQAFLHQSPGAQSSGICVRVSIFVYILKIFALCRHISDIYFAVAIFARIIYNPNEPLESRTDSDPRFMCKYFYYNLFAQINKIEKEI